MKPFAEWLERKRSGPKPRRPIKRNVRPKRMSDRRRVESRIYSVKRETFLREHPVCERCRNAPSTDVHHREKRGRNYLREETWLAVCRGCHEFIHEHPKEARALGLLK